MRRSWTGQLGQSAHFRLRPALTAAGIKRYRAALEDHRESELLTLPNLNLETGTLEHRLLSASHKPSPAASFAPLLGAVAS